MGTSVQILHVSFLLHLDVNCVRNMKDKHVIQRLALCGPESLKGYLGKQ